MSKPTTHEGHEEQHVSHDRSYWVVFGALAMFTAVELAVPGFLGGIRPLMIIVLMALASAKALLVAAFYMHLTFEQMALRVLAASPLILVAVLILLIMADVTSVDQAGWTFIGHADNLRFTTSHDDPGATQR